MGESRIRMTRHGCPSSVSADSCGSGSLVS
jgi:hypothetical protein